MYLITQYYIKLQYHIKVDAVTASFIFLTFNNCPAMAQISTVQNELFHWTIKYKKTEKGFLILSTCHKEKDGNLVNVTNVELINAEICK